MADFDIKRNDTRPFLRVALGYDDGTDANLSIASAVKFLMKDCKSGRLKVSAGVATVVDAANGVVEYQWVTGDTDTAGRFDIEWEVTWADGRIQTFPGEGYGVVNVTADLG
jgi:hypothetical protein